jgi:hypothetical protein
MNAGQQTGDEVCVKPRIKAERLVFYRFKEALVNGATRQKESRVGCVYCGY